jgi:hypothetical protein
MTQRMTLATVAGEAARVISGLFDRWRALAGDEEHNERRSQEIDTFCSQLRANGHARQVLYFTEWIDTWLLGNVLLGPQPFWARRFQTASFSREEAKAWAERCGEQFQEQVWLAARLREAAQVWQPLPSAPSVVVVIREVLGVSISDEDIIPSLGVVPSWLQMDEKPG